MYKLIKRYPSLPDWVEPGTTVEQGAPPWGNQGYVAVKDDRSDDLWFDVEEIENYPEFWKPCNNKYEIRSIIEESPASNPMILDDESNIRAWKDGNGEDMWRIHSFKSLPDGIVYTEGDYIKWDWLSEGLDYVKIKKFRLRDSRLQFKTTTNYTHWFDFFELLEERGLEHASGEGIPDWKPVLTNPSDPLEGYIVINRQTGNEVALINGRDPKDNLNRMQAIRIAKQLNLLDKK